LTALLDYDWPFADARRFEKEFPMSGAGAARQNAVKPVDPIWSAVRREAAEAAASDPVLAAFLYATVLNHDRLEDAVIHRVAERLDHADLGADLIRQTGQAMAQDATPPATAS
jgi:serine O-acetyltransferase